MHFPERGVGVSNSLVTSVTFRLRPAGLSLLIWNMRAASLQQLIRHAFRSGSHSLDCAPVGVGRDEALVTKDRAISSNGPADKVAERGRTDKAGRKTINVQP